MKERKTERKTERKKERKQDRKKERKKGEKNEGGRGNGIQRARNERMRNQCALKGRKEEYSLA